MSITITCPRCNHEFDLLHARDDDDWRLLIEIMLSLPPVTHRSMWAYLSLFRGSSKLRSSKMLRVVKQLAPMIKAAEVQRNGTGYVVPPDTFAHAMEHLVDNPPATLKLPLKGNGYLLSILANNAETALVQSEKKHEQQKRTPYRDVTHKPEQHVAPQPEESKRKVSTSMPADFKKLAGGLSATVRKKHNSDGEQ